jgi:hypothetical protein
MGSLNDLPQDLLRTLGVAELQVEMPLIVSDGRFQRAGRRSQRLRVLQVFVSPREVAGIELQAEGIQGAILLEPGMRVRGYESRRDSQMAASFIEVAGLSFLPRYCFVE